MQVRIVFQMQGAGQVAVDKVLEAPFAGFAELALVLFCLLALQYFLEERAVFVRVFLEDALVLI